MGRLIRRRSVAQQRNQQPGIFLVKLVNGIHQVEKTGVPDLGIQTGCVDIRRQLLQTKGRQRPCTGDDQHHKPRLDLKNSFSNAAHSSASTPSVTLTR